MKNRLLFLFLIMLINVSCGAEDLAVERGSMVEEQIMARGVKDQRVLDAMRFVPRHFFVLPDDVHLAYADQPLYIGEGQTISQPYIVALMSELMDLKGGERVLEIGTGSGYQAAVLSRLCKEVYTVEIVEGLYQRSAALLRKLGYENIFVRLCDGYQGWEEKAPFDAIMVTAAVRRIPPKLVEQLREGGRLVIPLGDSAFSQNLTVATKKGKDLDIRKVIPVIFVPMTGKIRE
ncbi:MAG: protein-L-isoaspartate(D-aspartate) O-methyltransferase [Nitrospinae bacterium]|nr:protein-L-isoaspartate(D-aspartate) O-methyltransferase [Nitrospinota bacterium]